MDIYGYSMTAAAKISSPQLVALAIYSQGDEGANSETGRKPVLCFCSEHRAPSTTHRKE
jgi:hypothetical protein